MINREEYDEQRAGLSEQTMAGAIDASWLEPLSALCSQLADLPSPCDEDVARLMHLDRQSQGVDE